METKKINSTEKSKINGIQIDIEILKNCLSDNIPYNFDNGNEIKWYDKSEGDVTSDNLLVGSLGDGSFKYIGQIENKTLERKGVGINYYRNGDIY